MNWTHDFAVKLTAPPARVFAALTDAAESRAWFAEALEVGSRVGAPYRFWGRHTLDHPTEAAADQAITAWEAGRRLGFSWRVHGVPSVVTLELEPHGEAGTQLRLRQEFESALPLERPRELIDPVVGGRYRLNWSYRVDGRDVESGTTRVLALEPNRKLVLDWLDWRGNANATGQTITFLLEPVGAATRVTFVHAGFTRTADIGDYPFGWVYCMDLRKAELARG